MKKLLSLSLVCGTVLTGCLGTSEMIIATEPPVSTEANLTKDTTLGNDLVVQYDESATTMFVGENINDLNANIQVVYPSGDIIQVAQDKISYTSINTNTPGSYDVIATISIPDVNNVGDNIYVERTIPVTIKPKIFSWIEGYNLGRIYGDAALGEEATEQILNDCFYTPELILTKKETAPEYYYESHIPPYRRLTQRTKMFDMVSNLYKTALSPNTYTRTEITKRASQVNDPIPYIWGTMNVPHDSPEKIIPYGPMLVSEIYVTKSIVSKSTHSEDGFAFKGSTLQHSNPLNELVTVGATSVYGEIRYTDGKPWLDIDYFNTPDGYRDDRYTITMSENLSMWSMFVPDRPDVGEHAAWYSTAIRWDATDQMYYGVNVGLTALDDASSTDDIESNLDFFAFNKDRTKISLFNSTNQDFWSHCGSDNPPDEDYIRGKIWDTRYEVDPISGASVADINAYFNTSALDFAPDRRIDEYEVTTW